MENPERAGVEADVLMKIGDSDNLSRWHKFQRASSIGVFPRTNSSVKLFDRGGQLVRGAEVLVASLVRSKTDRQRVARFFVPHTACYAMFIRYGKHQELLYEEWLSPRIDSHPQATLQSWSTGHSLVQGVTLQ